MGNQSSNQSTVTQPLKPGELPIPVERKTLTFFRRSRDIQIAISVKDGNSTNGALVGTLASSTWELTPPLKELPFVEK